MVRRTSCATRSRSTLSPSASSFAHAASVKGSRHARRLAQPRHAHVEAEGHLRRLDEAGDRRRRAVMRRRAQRQMAFAAEQARGRVHADPAGAGNIDLGPGVQVGEILVRAARAFDRIDVGPELDEIARDEARGEAEPAQDLHQQPCRIAARARPQRQRLVRFLDARLHADDVMDHPLQLGVERDQERDRPAAPRRDLGEIFRQQRAGGFRREIGGELGRQFVRIGEGKFLGVGLDEKVEGIDDRELGGQVDLDLEFLDRLGKDVARQPVAVRVLLPIDEVIGRRDLERIARHPGAAVRRRTQPDRLGPQRDRPIVGVAGDVVEADENRQGIAFRDGRRRPHVQGAGRGAIWRQRRLACQR